MVAFVESNRSVFVRTFLIVIVLSIVFFGLLALERTGLQHAGEGMYSTPTPPYISVFLHHSIHPIRPFDFIDRNINHIVSFWTCGN